MIQLGKPRLRRLADSLFVYIKGGLCIYVYIYIYTHIHKQLKIELFEGYLSKISHVRERFTLIRNMFKNPQPTGSPLARFFFEPNNRLQGSEFGMY